MNRLGRFALALGVCLTARQISAQTPQISAGGVLNAASFAQPGVLAPGMLFAVLGTSLSNGGTAVAPGGSSLPTRLAGARVLVNGVAAPLLYASSGLIDAEFPVELARITSASLQVEVQSASGTVTSSPIAVTVVPYSPGIFTLAESGTGPGTIFRASDSSVICPAGRSDCSPNPAVPGEVVSIYMTGIGGVNGPWSSGQAAQSASSTVATPQVTVGGAKAQVLFSGLVKGSVGLYQVDIILPAGLPAGDSVPVTVTVESTASNQVTISIGAASVPQGSSQGGGPPGGGSVTAFALDPVHHYTLYAGTPIGGVFKTTNGGQSWFAANNGLPSAPVSVLVVDPSNSGVVYAGTHGGGPNDGVYKTIDGGATWNPVKNGLTRGISALAIAPDNPNMLYASTNASGVFKSTDGGANWTNVNNGLSNPVGPGLVIDPFHSATLYAADAGGVSKSTDGAASWTLLSNANVQGLAIDPLNPTTLYITTFSSGVFKSTDGGTSWTAASNGIPAGSVSAVTVDPLSPATVYVGYGGGGVFKTTDGGANWSATGLSTGSVNALVVDPVSDSTVYAATIAGLYKSIDGGSNWTPDLKGFTNTSVTAMAVDPVNSGTLYVAASGRGVFKTTDGGASWSDGTPSGSSVTVLAIDPLNPAVLYAGTNNGGGVFKTTDGGQTWKPMNSGLTPFNNQIPPVQTLAIDPRTSATVYAGLLNGIFKSTDGGGNWTALGGISVLPGFIMAIDPVNSATLYAAGAIGSDPNAFLSKSSNGGLSWTPLNSAPQPLSVLVIDPRTPSTLYALTVVGIILKSIDGGLIWSYTGNGLPPVNALVIDPVNTSTLYVGRPDGALYKSTNGGDRWALSSTGLPANASIMKLAIDPHNPATLYAGTSNEGVFKSTDGAATWQPTGSN